MKIPVHAHPEAVQAVLDRIQSRRAKVGIIGPGYVGLLAFKTRVRLRSTNKITAEQVTRWLMAY